MELTEQAVNTGVGASADTRTTAVDDLQQAVIKTLNCGIFDSTGSGNDLGNLPYGAPVRDGETLDALPIAWTRAAELVRINSLIGGNSGIRLEMLQTLAQLLKADIVPNMPLRGSISASGDLSPLAYLAGALQGNPGIQVWTGPSKTRRLTSASAALKEAGITLVKYAPKEAVALANGTSVSAGAAALVLQEAHGGMILAQVLTAMAVEGLNGTEESFDAYISAVRPHPGQIEAARNVRSFLKGSNLARKANTENVDGLRQDRYALRTSPQWIGPELENIALAHEQIIIECNSITDNPLVKGDGTVLQGGNFQAQAVTSAMDKTRMALSSIGRMLFQQSTELMNPVTNNGLPPNLTADEPSQDFLLKGMDIASASYQSELGFLSHGTTPFVMVAEQGNESLNSMALMSTRYTHRALDIYMQLCSNSLLALCQALDLRAIQHSFDSKLESLFTSQLPLLAQDWLVDPTQAEPIRQELLDRFKSELRQRITLDREERFQAALSTVRSAAIDIAQDSCREDALPAVYAELKRWSKSMTAQALALSRQILESHSTTKTLPLLGHASKRIFAYVRNELDVPFLRGDKLGPQNIHTFQGTELGTTIGTYTSRIYHSLRNGGLLVPVMESLRGATSVETEQVESKKTTISSPEAAKTSIVADSGQSKTMHARSKSCHAEGSILANGSGGPVWGLSI